MTQYVLFNRLTQSLVGIDMASGGYPYDARDLNAVEFWTNLEKITAYQKMFPYLEIKTFHYQTSDVPSTTH